MLDDCYHMVTLDRQRSVVVDRAVEFAVRLTQKLQEKAAVKELLKVRVPASKQHPEDQKISVAVDLHRGAFSFFGSLTCLASGPRQRLTGWEPLWPSPAGPHCIGEDLLARGSR